MNIEELIKKKNGEILSPDAYDLAESMFNSDFSKINYFSVSFKLISGDKGRLYTTIMYNNLPFTYKGSALPKSKCIDILNRVKALNGENPLYSYDDILGVDIVNLKTFKLCDDGITVNSKYGILLTIEYVDDDFDKACLYIRPGNILKFKKDLSDVGRYDLLMLLEG